MIDAVSADMLELQPDLLQQRTLSYTIGDQDPLWPALKTSQLDTLGLVADPEEKRRKLL